MSHKKFWIMDYETIVNCFVAVFTGYASDETRIFVVNRDRNDLPEFLDFLDENIDHKDWHFGYNNLAFDAQITEFILENRDELSYLSSDDFTATIAQYAGSVIAKSNRGE